jgi:two-component system, cell cycle response regulator DivK
LENRRPLVRREKGSHDVFALEPRLQLAIQPGMAVLQARTQFIGQQTVRRTMKILYIEDNDDSVYMLKSRLALAGFTVIIATDGAQGVANCDLGAARSHSHGPQRAVLDGWEATGRIKALVATKHIPVIAITANAMAGDKEKAMAAGCDDFDTKPVDMPRLLGKIRALMPSALRRPATAACRR